MLDTNSMLKIVDECLEKLQERLDINKIERGSISTLLYNVCGEMYSLTDIEDSERYYVFRFTRVIRDERGVASQKFVKFRKISNCIIQHSFPTDYSLFPITYNPFNNNFITYHIINNIITDVSSTEDFNINNLPIPTLKDNVTIFKLTSDEKKLIRDDYNKHYYNSVTIDKRNKVRETKLTKVCPICNKTFTATNGNNIYCPNCKSTATKLVYKTYVENNKEHIKEVQKAWVLNNPDKVKAIAKKYHDSEKFKKVVKKYQNSKKGKLALKKGYEKRKAMLQESNGEV